MLIYLLLMHEIALVVVMKKKQLFNFLEINMEFIASQYQNNYFHQTQN